MAKPVGQLERSLAALTIGVQRSMGRRAQAGLSERAGEVTQQVQLPLSGSAALAPAFVDLAVTWRLPFTFAPQQRLSNFQVPQFSYGIEFVEAPDGIVTLHASVLGWNKDARNWIVGAVVRVVVQAPGSGETNTVDYSAVAHLSFQGYAAQPEDTGV